MFAGNSELSNMVMKKTRSVSRLRLHNQLCESKGVQSDGVQWVALSRDDS